MSQITIPNILKDQFSPPGPIPVFDEAGKSLGVFLPNAQSLPGEPFWTRAELDASFNESGGRTLDEILSSLSSK